jgi:hypothetical protein
MSKRTEALLERSAKLDWAPGAGRRHEELIEQAMAAGHTREYAEMIFAVAIEEQLDPAVAFEVVRSGVGVRELAGSSPDQSEEAQVEAPPAWVSDESFHTEVAMRERLVRTTFRRLRATIEGSSSVVEAMRAFVREPDVGDVEY